MTKSPRNKTRPTSGHAVTSDIVVPVVTGDAAAHPAVHNLQSGTRTEKMCHKKQRVARKDVSSRHTLAGKRKAKLKMKRKSKNSSEAEKNALSVPPAKARRSVRQVKEEDTFPIVRELQALLRQEEGSFAKNNNKSTTKRKGCCCWVPHPGDANRFDFPGTTHNNELVKHRPECFCSRYFHVESTNDSNQNKSSKSSKNNDKGKFWYNFVKFFVHPLHNFLQFHFGLDNEDEIQLMVLPLTPPAAASAGGASSSTAKARGGGSEGRECYFASNTEKITQEMLDAAMANWKVASHVYRVRRMTLVRGEPGRHAEQKLLEHLRRNLPAQNTTTGNEENGARHQNQCQEKAVILGERLPCAVCRLFAVDYEDIAVMLPSHGHFYLTTVAPTSTALASSNVPGTQGSRNSSRASSVGHMSAQEAFAILRRNHRVCVG